MVHHYASSILLTPSAMTNIGSTFPPYVPPCYDYAPKKNVIEYYK